MVLLLWSLLMAIVSPYTAWGQSDIDLLGVCRLDMMDNMSPPQRPESLRRGGGHQASKRVWHISPETTNLFKAAVWLFMLVNKIISKIAQNVAF